MRKLLNLLPGRRRRMERELERELRYHLDRRAEDLMRDGVSEVDARRRASLELGGAAQVQEEVRDTWLWRWLDDGWRDLRYAARLLRRTPGFTAIVVFTLGLAVAAVVTVFGVVDAWVLKPLSFPQADRLAIAFAARPERPAEPAVFLPYRAFVAWQERSQSFTALAAAFPRDVVLTDGSDAQSLLGLSVSARFFEVFGVAPSVGRVLDDVDAREGARRIVLSHGLWQRRFGGASDVVGASVVLGGVPHEVVGVMPRDFDTRVLDMRFEFWSTLPAGERGYTSSGASPVSIIGRLAPGQSVASAAAEVAAITQQTESAYAVNFNRFVVNLVRLQDDNARSVRATLVTVSVAVVALLVAAAMNVGSLLLGRGMARGHEAALRSAIGCGRGRLIRQFFTESALMAGLGGLLGVGLAAVAIRLFTAWNPLRALPATAISIDLRVLVAAAAATGFVAIVAGLVPALRISATDASDALRSGGERTTAASSRRAQALLLVLQIAVSVVVIVSTTLLVRTYGRLQATPLGFDADGVSVATMVLPAEAFPTAVARNAFYGELASRLRAMPGVEGVTAGTSALLTSGPPVTVHTGPDNDPNAPRISAQEVSAEFFATLRIPVIAGRGFTGHDAGGSAPVMVINERAAVDLFGSAEAAIGRQLRLDREGPRQIVGVVGTVRSTFFNTLEWKADPVVYRPAAQAFAAINSPTAASFTLKLHLRADGNVTLPALRAAAAAVSPRAAVTEMRTAASLVADATVQPSFRMRLLSWLTGASVVLMAIGIYGLVAQAAQQRRREIAIRSALGATRGAVVRSVVTEALLIAAAGIAMGMVGALLLAGTLEALLYGVNARDTMSLTASAMVAFATAAIAAVMPAWRAASGDPTAALRL